MAHHTFCQRTLHADLETPVSTFLKLNPQYDYACVYESVEGRSVWASYSILAFGARRIFTSKAGELTISSGERRQTMAAPDPLAALRSAYFGGERPCTADMPPFLGGIFGYLAYDAVRRFEPIGNSEASAEVPDLLFFEPELFVVFDNRQHSLTLYAGEPDILEQAVRLLGTPLVLGPSDATATHRWQQPQARDSDEAFRRSVLQAKEHIRAGDIIQVVLSRRFEMPRVAAPFDIYRGLRTINPSPYLFYIKTPTLELAGASPEVMVRVQKDVVTVRPIAGTRPRGSSPSEDERLAAELRADPKELAEHIMLVDLGRNDVGRVAAPGTVKVTDLMVVEPYSHVMHLVSQVEGLLHKERGIDAFDALRAAFPAGTLSGAPKVRAMQIIEHLEQRRRGIYGGAVGYFGPHGDADFGIAIRTLEAHNDRLVVQAGAGIVADSDPKKETEEAAHKARAVFRAARWATELQAGQ